MKKNKRLISNQNIQYQIDNEIVYFDNLTHGTSKTETNIQGLEIYNFCQTSRTFLEVSEQSFFISKILEILIDNFIIFYEDELFFLEKGFLNDSQLIIGEKLKYNSELEKNSFIFLGVPTDIAGSVGGSREGPFLIRQSLFKYINKIKEAKRSNNKIHDFDLRKCYDVSKLIIADLGDIHCDINENIFTYGYRISKAMDYILESDSIPIILGGDHSISYFCIENLKKKYKRFGIIHFDAHHDI